MQPELEPELELYVRISGSPRVRISAFRLTAATPAAVLGSVEKSGNVKEPRW